MVANRQFVKFDNFVKLVANGCGLNNSSCPKISPARHLAQVELADQVERSLFCHLQPVLDQACRDKWPRDQQFDQVGQFRVGALLFEPPLHLAFRQHETVNAPSGHCCIVNGIERGQQAIAPIARPPPLPRNVFGAEMQAGEMVRGKRLPAAGARPPVAALARRRAAALRCFAKPRVESRRITDVTPAWRRAWPAVALTIDKTALWRLN